MNPSPAAFALLLASSVGLVNAAPPPRPNILFVLSDDHSYPFLGCYGDPNVRTPALDRLAAEGVKFHRFFAVSPQCVPARAGFLTGRSAVAARMTRFSALLPRDEPTFLEQLREQAGYHTGICGRSYHLDGSGAHFRGTIGRFLDEQGLRTFAQRVDYLRVGTDTEAIGQMREFLDQRPRDKPFCLWLNFSDPHHPWTAPASDRPDAATLKLPAYLPDLPAVRGQLADHLAEINRLDHSMQATLDLLAERGLAANTLVIFIGDNGSALPHGKGSLYDPGVNVPLVMRWPGVIAAGGDSRALLSGEDLAPTILAAAGLPAGPRMSGRSFLPLLIGGAYQPREHVFFERGPHALAPVTVAVRSDDFDLSRSVRSERHKLIYNCTPWIPYAPVDLAADAGWGEITAARNRERLTAGQRATYLTTPRPVYELYDLEADPAELENLSGRPAFRDIEAKLRVALAEKMILDSDYLPLPALLEGAAPSPVSGPAGTKTP